MVDTNKPNDLDILQQYMDENNIASWVGLLTQEAKNSFLLTEKAYEYIDKQKKLNNEKSNEIK